MDISYQQSLGPKTHALIRQYGLGRELSSGPFGLKTFAPPSGLRPGEKYLETINPYNLLPSFGTVKSAAELSQERKQRQEAERNEYLNRQLEQSALEQQRRVAEKQLREQEQIASGRFMLNGEAVTSDQMREYQQRIQELVQADPMYMAYKQGLGEGTGQISNEQEYQNYLANKKSDTGFQDYQLNALRGSLEQFQQDPLSYLIGGGQGGSTYSPSDLLEYLGLGQQLFRSTGQEGNFMDFLLGGTQPGVTNPPNPAARAFNEAGQKYGGLSSNFLFG
jgi:hypothetical protein